MPSPAPMPNFASKVNITAVKSGNASDPSVWNLNRPLQAGDWFHVPAGLALAWNLLSCPDLGGGYVGGVLDCGSAPGDKVMNLATLVIASGGTYACGSCVTNTPLAGTFTLTFTDTPIDESFDPGHFGTGFLTMGATVDLCGSANKTAWTWTPSAHAGATTLNLLTIPAEWLPGDQLLIPGCVLSPVQDEVVAIQSVSGSTVTLTAPLQFDHLPMPGPQGQVNNLPVGNLTRKIVFQSANPNGTRGHIMFMRDMMGMPSVVNACHVLCKGLGRTLATQPVTDPQVDDSGVLVPGTADNPRARYAWHSHRQGQNAAALQTWDSLVVWDFKKWAFDNHDSNVNATNLIGYDGQGAAFATERGSEVGCYKNSFACRTSGSGTEEGLDVRRNVDDYGFLGTGIWLQGPGVVCTGNMLCNHFFADIVCDFGETPIAGVITDTFPAALVPEAAWATGVPLRNGELVITYLPAFGLSGNIGFGSPLGLLLWKHNPLQQGPAINLTTWGEPTCIRFLYSSGKILLDPRAAGPQAAPRSVGVDISLGYVNRYEIAATAQLAGFEVGVRLPNRPSTFDPTLIHGGYYANVWDFALDNAAGSMFAPTVRFTDEPTWGEMPAELLDGRTHYRYLLGEPLDFASWYTSVSLNGFLNGYTFPLQAPPVQLADGRQLFWSEQLSNYVPIPSDKAPAGTPAELVGLTNAELLQQFGLTTGTVLADGAASDPATNGLLGPAVAYPPPWALFSTYAPSSLDNYQLVLVLADNASAFDGVGAQTYYRDAAPITLRPGWQRLTRTINGQLVTHFVLGPQTSSATVSLGSPVQTPRREFDLSIPVTASDGGTVNDGTLTVTIQQNGVTVLALSALVSGGVAKFGKVDLAVGTYTLAESYAGSATLPAASGVGTFAVS